MEARTATGDLSCAGDTGPHIPGATQQRHTFSSLLLFHATAGFATLSIRSHRRAMHIMNISIGLESRDAISTRECVNLILHALLELYANSEK